MRTPAWPGPRPRRQARRPSLRQALTRSPRPGPRLRAAAAAMAILALLLAGCLWPAAPEPPTVTSGGAMVFRAEGERIVPVPLPEAFQRPGAGARGGAGPAGQDPSGKTAGLAIATASTGFAGAEPNIGVTPGGSVYVSAYERIVRSQDGGRTWQEMHHMRLGQTFDPMLWVDAVTGRVLSTHIHPEQTCSTLIVGERTDARQPEWREVPLRCPSPVVDHQKVATGPHTGPLTPPLPPPSANPLHPRLVSLCYNKIVATHCAVSHDGGLTYLLDVPIDAAPGQPGGGAAGGPASCGGLTGHQVHAPDGTLLLPYGFACREGRIAVSSDGGLTWARIDLDVPQLEVDPEAAVDAGGMAYYLYRGDDQAMRLLRSRDRFATVEGPFRVSPPEVAGTVFAGLAAGADGRIAVAYLGTRDSDAGPDDAPASTRWHLFVGMSLDAQAPAPTFVTVQATPDGDPVQRGSICHSKECKDGNRNLLDFIDLGLGPDGRVWVSYTDGCTSARCLRAGADAATSRDDTVAVAWVSEGPSLAGDRWLGPP